MAKVSDTLLLLRRHGKILDAHTALLHEHSALLQTMGAELKAQTALLQQVLAEFRGLRIDVGRLDNLDTRVTRLETKRDDAPSAA